MLGTKKHKLLFRIPTHLLFVFDAFSSPAAFFYLSVCFYLDFQPKIWHLFVEIYIVHVYY